MHTLRSRRGHRAARARISGAPLIAVTVAAALVLSSCGGAPKPDPLPKSSTSESPPASPSATPPVMPAAAKEKTRAGAITFARGFLDALNYSGSTGATEPLRALYMPLCTRCEAVADSIDRTYADGGSIDGGAWHATTFKFYGIRNDVAFVDALVDYDAQTWIKKKGAAPAEFPASRRNLKAFNLRWSQSGWVVSALDPKR